MLSHSTMLATSLSLHYNVSKTGLGKTMPLTQQWLQDPLQCCQNRPRKNNASHSTVATRPITMFPTRLTRFRHRKNASHSHHHFQEWLITTFYIINIKANTPKCALVGNSMVFKPPITNMCNIINKENSIIITLISQF
jgi:hypothetical protein